MSTQQKAESILQAMTISGGEVRRLMRKRKWTIRSLAAAMGITQKRVRQMRSDRYASAGHSAAELYERLTGSRRIYWLYVARAGHMARG